MSDKPDLRSNRSKRVRSEEFQDTVTGISWLVFIIGALSSFVSIGYEVFFWLKNGEWPNLRFSNVFAWLKLDPFSLVNNIEWQGIKKILLWFLGLPLTVGAVGLGAALGGAFYFIFSRKD